MMLSRAAALFLFSAGLASAEVHPMSSHPNSSTATTQQQQHHSSTSSHTTAAAAAPSHTQAAPSHKEAPPREQAGAPRKLPPFPDTRFTAWDALPQEMKDHAHKAGYHEKLWNKPASFGMEALDFESLDAPVKPEIAALMSPPQWDCYVNHFRNYDWEELNEHVAHYQTLGWTRDLWNADDSAETDIEGKYWQDLSDDQQKAASALCYTQELWDEVAIPLWNRDNGSGGESGEKDDANLYSAKETQVAEEKQDIYENLYDANDRSNNPFVGPASAHNNRNIPVPFFRYDPWALLNPDLQKLAIKAGYKEKSWNAIGSHPMERQDFETIGEKDPQVAHVLTKMGFTEKVWDCYMSHYLSYEWSELLEEGVQQYYQELGYDHKSWDLGREVDALAAYWPDLTPTQQNAAFEVGYFREVWDEVSIQFWPRTTSNSASLKEYAKNHKAAVGGGLVVTLIILVGFIFACAWCYNKSKQSKSSSIPKDLEMYPPSFGGYSDDPAHDPEAAGYPDIEKTPTIC